MSQNGVGRDRSIVLVVVLLLISGCASAPTPGPTAHPFDEVRRLAIIVSAFDYAHLFKQ